MLPHLGAGAGMGIEDAYVLSQLLSHPQTNISNIEVRILCFCVALYQMLIFIVERIKSLRLDSCSACFRHCACQQTRW
jgi:hypothetical protein